MGGDRYDSGAGTIFSFFAVLLAGLVGVALIGAAMGYLIEQFVS